MMDTIDKTIFERPVKLQSGNTWSPFDESLQPGEQKTETLFFDEITDTEAEIGRYDDLGELGIGGMGEVRKDPRSHPKSHTGNEDYSSPNALTSSSHLSLY